MEITERNYMHAVAALAALQVYRGDKNTGHAIIRCLAAADYLGLASAASAASQSVGDDAKQAAAHSLLAEQIVCASKSLGLFEDEPAGEVTDEWLDATKRRLGFSDWAQWFGV